VHLPEKLGACRRCIALTLAGLAASAGASAAVADEAAAPIRLAAHLSTAAFGALGLLHSGAAIGRALLRPPPARPPGCNCRPRRRRFGGR
jgi:hypothetical protein